MASKSVKPSVEWAQRIVRAALKAEHVNGRTVGVRIVDNKEIQRINVESLQHDYPTDVISFGLEGVKLTVPEKKQKHLGDLIVSSQMADETAVELGITPEEELARYLVHGTLHLLGYNDDRPAAKKKMFKRQETILKGLFKKKGR